MLYYLQHSYIIGLFGKWVQNRIVGEAKEYIRNHPDETLKLKRIKEDALHGNQYIHSFDFQFSESFYTGSWFDGVKQEAILMGIKCPAVYLKAKTKYGPKKVLWAANTEEASKRIKKDSGRKAGRIAVTAGCKRG